jgi:hypothetical protein
VIESLDRAPGDKINFADYMFIRKANLAWKECARNDRIDRRKMACAI